MYLNDVFTIPVNLAGLPGDLGAGGLHAAGAADRAAAHRRAPSTRPRVLRVAHAYEQATDWHPARPALGDERPRYETVIGLEVHAQLC